MAAIGILIKVSKALRNSDGAAATYREDCLFMESLAATLEKVHQELGDGSPLVEFNAQVKAIHDAIVKMQKRLGTFQTTLNKDDDHNFARLLRSLPKKVEYGIFVSKQVGELRTQIAAPLQDVQLRLGLQTLNLVSGLSTEVGSLSLNVDKIETMIQTTLATHFMRHDQAETSRRREILKWLKSIDMEEVYRESLRRILDDSCEWLFQRQEYSRWSQRLSTNKPSSLLWIVGIPGAGKTMIATRAIEKLQQSCQVAYFYCNTNRAETRNSLSIVRSWAWQLLKRAEKIPDEVGNLYDSGSEANFPTMNSCLDVLLDEEISSDASTNQVFILDGLDECESSEIGTICRTLDHLSNKANVLLFSREQNDISTELIKAMRQRSFEKLSITKLDTDTDIKRFIQREVKSLGLPEKDIEQSVIETLQAGAQGMFQWADQMIQYLAEPGKVFAEEYLDALKDMPQSLEELYSRILASLPNRGPLLSRSRVLLQWLSCALRPLTLSEIGAILELTIDQQRRSNRTMVDLSRLRQVVSHCCGTFVRYVDTDDKRTVVTLVHASVKEFLLGTSRVDGSFANPLINQQVTDKLICQYCLSYLCYDDIGFAPFDVEADALEKIQDTVETMNTKFAAYLDQFPLLEYAAINWHKHLIRAGKSLTSTSSAYEKTLNSFCSSTVSTIKWLQLYLRLRGDQLIYLTSQSVKDIEEIATIKGHLSDPSTFEKWLAHLIGPDHGRFVRWQRFLNAGFACDFLPALHVAAFFDFHEFLQDRIHSGANTNELSVTGQTPLILAARGDSAVATKLLLKLGANPNAIGWSTNTALSWAIDAEAWRPRKKSGPFNVAPILLEAGADPNLVYGSFAPLYRACKSPYSDDPFLLNVVTLLLEKGATKFIDGHPREEPPLFWAVMHEAPKLTSLLLQHGANANGDPSRNPGSIPLLSLLLKQHPSIQIIRLLLDAGADVNITTVDGRTPLHLSAHCPHEVASLLLECGAPVNKEADDGSLPIHDAVRENNIPVIKLLISHGSDINKEDSTGNSPLSIAVDSKFQDAIQLLVTAGAHERGEGWHIYQDSGEMRVTRRERAYYPQNPQDIVEMHTLLYMLLRKNSKSGIPRRIVLRILDNARYWLKSTTSRFEKVMVDQDVAKLEQPYVLSEPVQGRANMPVREIKFVIRSHDQGWSDYPQHHGTYMESMTWFDIYIQKANNERVDFGTVDKCLTRNVHASRTPKEHSILYRRDPFSRRNCTWLDWIEPGDRVGILPKAIYGGWVNHVESASIDIFSTNLPEQ